MSRVSDFSRAPGFPSRAWFASICRLSLALSLSFAAVPSFYAQEQSAITISRQVKDIFGRMAGAVVKIHGVDEHGPICGTGFFIDPTGTLYTAYDVGGEAGDFTIEFGGKKYPARQLLADIRSGTAILKVDLVTPELPIGKSEDLEVATPVVSIGYPLDLGKTPSFGMVAGFDRKYRGRYFSTTHVRLNLPTQRGEAGAPLLNMKGEVVGIVVSSLENNSACYAVPIEVAEKLRSDYIRFGEARHGWIGINVSMARQPVEGSLAEMTQIEQGSPAANSGIKSGDVLLQVGQRKVTQPEDVPDASFFITAGDIVPITVVRSNQKMTFNVQATLHPRQLLDGAPAAVALPSYQAIPLKLESEPQRTP
jgi:serine protease Do